MWKKGEINRGDTVAVRRGETGGVLHLGGRPRNGRIGKHPGHPQNTRVPVGGPDYLPRVPPEEGRIGKFFHYGRWKVLRILRCILRGLDMPI